MIYRASIIRQLNQSSYAKILLTVCFCPDGDRIGPKLDCPSDSPNECWCDGDRFTLATSLINTCVEKYCTIGGWQQDYLSAESVYEGYCVGAGYTPISTGPASTVASTTIDSHSPTVTKVTFVTETSASTSSGTVDTGG